MVMKFGRLIRAAAAGPPSPVDGSGTTMSGGCGGAFPAIVVMIPVAASIRRMRWFNVSAMYRLPRVETENSSVVPESWDEGPPSPENPRPLLVSGV